MLLYLALALTGAGMAAAFSPLMTAVLMRVPVADAADATGVVVTVNQLAIVIGVATFGTLYLNQAGPLPGPGGARGVHPGVRARGRGDVHGPGRRGAGGRRPGPGPGAGRPPGPDAGDPVPAVAAAVPRRGQPGRSRPRRPRRVAVHMGLWRHADQDAGHITGLAHQRPLCPGPCTRSVTCRPGPAAGRGSAERRRSTRPRATRPGLRPGGGRGGRGDRGPTGLGSWDVMALTDAALRRPPLDAAALSARLVRPGGLWREIRVTSETGSTNADLLAEARAGAAEGLVLVAETPDRGPGPAGPVLVQPAARRADVLRAAPPGGRAARRPGLAAAAHRDRGGGRAARRGRRHRQPEVAERRAGGGRKIAGILAEAHGDAIVAGVGLNVTLTRAELPVPTATSLLLENAACLDRERLLAAMLTELASRYTAWAAGPDAGRACARSTCAGASRSAARSGWNCPAGPLLTGTATDVDETGPAGRADRPGHHAGRRGRRRARPLTSLRSAPRHAPSAEHPVPCHDVRYEHGKPALRRESGAC